MGFRGEAFATDQPRGEGSALRLDLDVTKRCGRCCCFRACSFCYCTEAALGAPATQCPNTRDPAGPSASAASGGGKGRQNKANKGVDVYLHHHRDGSRSAWTASATSRRPSRMSSRWTTTAAAVSSNTRTRMETGWSFEIRRTS